MIWAISYGDKKYEKSRDFNLKTAISKGKADKVIAYGPEDIDEDFYNKNEAILSQPRGGGYWLWKPYIILKTLNQMPENDYLIYADGGTTYIRKIQHLINSMEANNQSVMCFDVGSLEKKYTKRDIFIATSCDTTEFTDSHQRMATIILLKNCPYSKAIIKEWLEYCQNESLITDKTNTYGQPNYPEFVDNRHDQSIWSLITKKNHIPAFRDPTQWGKKNHKNRLISLGTYPIVFLHHRSGQINSWLSLYKKTVFLYLFNNMKMFKKIYTFTNKMYIFYAKIKIKLNKR